MQNLLRRPRRAEYQLLDALTIGHGAGNLQNIKVTFLVKIILIMVVIKNYTV